MAWVGHQARKEDGSILIRGTAAEIGVLDPDQANDFADLVADALNVKHRSGRTPSQLEAEVARLTERDQRLMTKLGNFKGTGNPQIDACLLQPDPHFEAFRQSLPDNYWARYDPSAVRIGFHYGRLTEQAQIQQYPGDFYQDSGKAK